VIVDAHSKEFFGVKLHQTVFLINRIRQIYRYSLHCTKKALDKGLVPLIYDFVVIAAYNLCDLKGFKHMGVMFQHSGIHFSFICLHFSRSKLPLQNGHWVWEFTWFVSVAGTFIYGTWNIKHHNIVYIRSNGSNK